MSSVDYTTTLEGVDIYNEDFSKVVRKDSMWKLFINENLVLTLTLVGKTNNVNILISEKYDNDDSKKVITLERLNEGGLINPQKWTFTSSGMVGCLKDQEGKTILSFIVRENLKEDSYSLIILQSVSSGNHYDYILNKELKGKELF